MLVMCFQSLLHDLRQRLIEKNLSHKNNRGWSSLIIYSINGKIYKIYSSYGEVTWSLKSLDNASTGFTPVR